MDPEMRVAMMEMMGVVLEECARRDLLPMILIAARDGEAAILPCGPGADPQQIRDLLARAAQDVWLKPSTS